MTATIRAGALVAVLVLSNACARKADMALIAPEPMDADIGSAAAPASAVQQGFGAAAEFNDPAVQRTAIAGKGAAMDSSMGRADSTASDADADPSWDMDVRSYESTDRVEHYVEYFSGPARDRIAERLSRGTRYEPMIRRKMREGGLPEDLYYLAMVESGFNPNAYSRAAAVGMWQFMTSTGRDMGLRVDWWVDERRDPVKSTWAAVRFIKALKEQFGSVYLAAAAYNGGPGRISRGLTRYADDFEGTSGDDLFFALADKDYLKNETREYVPQLIAVALVAKEPDRYGLRIDSLPPFTYDSVRVGPATPLAAIAEASGAKVSDIQELNPHILRGLTPPRDSFQVRIPTGSSAGFASAFAALPKRDRVGLETRTTRRGEWLENIAHAAGLTYKELRAFNPKVRHYKSGKLVAGQKLLIPTRAVVAAAVNVPDPAIERYSSPRGRTHVVKPGENLSVIAKHYHTTTKAIMRANALKRSLIFPGQRLAIPRATSSR